MKIFDVATIIYFKMSFFGFLDHLCKSFMDFVLLLTLIPILLLHIVAYHLTCISKFTTHPLHTVVSMSGLNHWSTLLIENITSTVYSIYASIRQTMDSQLLDTPDSIGHEESGYIEVYYDNDDKKYKSQYAGVYYNKRNKKLKYTVQLIKGGKKVNKSFRTMEEAVTFREERDPLYRGYNAEYLEGKTEEYLARGEEMFSPRNSPVTPTLDELNGMEVDECLDGCSCEDVDQKDMLQERLHRQWLLGQRKEYADLYANDPCDHEYRWVSGSNPDADRGLTGDLLRCTFCKHETLAVEPSEEEWERMKANVNCTHRWNARCIRAQKCVHGQRPVITGKYTPYIPCTDSDDSQ